MAEENMVNVSFDLDEKICQMIEEMAKDENKSESEIVQEAIMDYTIARKKNKDIDAYENDFFKSKEKESLFYLTQLEGKQRNKLLGITDEHYADKKLAKEWYIKLSKLVHPDKGGTDEAFNTLNELYNTMVDY